MDKVETKHLRAILRAIEAGSQVINTPDSFNAIMALPPETKKAFARLLLGKAKYEPDRVFDIWMD